MIADVVRRLPIWNHPHVIAGIQIDGRDPSPWRLDEGQSHWSVDAHALSDITHVRSLAAFSERAYPPIGDRRDIQDAGFRIRSGALPVGGALIVRDRQRASFAAGARNDRRSVKRTELELRC